MNHAKQHIATLLGLLTIIVILVTVIDVTCFDKSFYNSQFAKLDVASEMGVSSTDLTTITDVLLDYTQGKRSDMIVKVNVSGSVQEVFNTREKDHMVDVRALYLKCRHVQKYCGSCCDRHECLIRISLSKTNNQDSGTRIPTGFGFVWDIIGFYSHLLSGRFQCFLDFLSPNLFPKRSLAIKSEYGLIDSDGTGTILQRLGHENHDPLHRCLLV